MADEQALAVEEKEREAGDAVAEAAAIMARLRGPNGCPWDREQTFDTIKRHTLEETYEVFDAIERRAWPELRDEILVDAGVYIIAETKTIMTAC